MSGTRWDDWDDDFDTAGPASVEPVESTAGHAQTAPTGPSQAQPAAETVTGPSYSEHPHDDVDDWMVPPPDKNDVRERAVSRARPRPERSRAVPAPEQPPAPTAPAPASAPMPSEPGGRKGLTVLVSVLVLMIVGSMGVALWVGPISDMRADNALDGLPLAQPVPTSQDAADESERMTAVQTAAQECQTSTASSETTVGNGKGSQDSGPEVILAFDHAYYDERSGSAARQLLDESIENTTAESLQEAIDTLPDDVAHCLRITPVDDEPDSYNVVLTEYLGGEAVATNVITQSITTEEKDGKFVIVDIVNE